jgi:hypothetical protein
MLTENNEGYKTNPLYHIAVEIGCVKKLTANRV